MNIGKLETIKNRRNPLQSSLMFKVIEDVATSGSDSLNTRLRGKKEKQGQIRIRRKTILPNYLRRCEPASQGWLSVAGARACGSSTSITKTTLIGSGGEKIPITENNLPLFKRRHQKILYMLTPVSEKKF